MKALGQIRTSTSAIAGGAAWSLIGRIGPFAIALLMIPLLVRSMGDARWGLFTLALTLLSMSSLFDLGLGRALTRELAERIANNDADGAAQVTVTALLAVAAAGCVGAILASVGVVVWMGLGDVVPASLQREATASLLVLCCAVPFMLVNAGLWGVLAAFQRFRAANLINVLVSGLYYVLPWIAVTISDSLINSMAALLVTRIIWTICYFALCVRLLPTLLEARPSFAILKRLLRSGGWMTLSNLSFPILSYADRFAVGAILSPAETGFYGTPADVSMRLGIIPAAITASAYPVLAATHQSNSATTAQVLSDTAKAILALMLPISAALIVFGKAFLILWLGHSFADKTGSVMPILAFGVLFTALDSLVATLVDGIGRPELNAKLSIAQMVIYIPLLIFLISIFGIVGAALAWSARTVVDLGLRSWIAGNAAPTLRPSLAKILARASLCGTLLILIAVSCALDSRIAAIFLIMVIPITAFGILNSGDRARLVAVISRKINRSSRPQKSEL